MLNEEMSAGRNAEQSKNDETQIPSSPTIGNTNVVRSPNSEDFDELENPNEIKFYTDKMKKYETYGFEKYVMDSCKLQLVRWAIRTGKCQELIDSLKNLFEYDKLLQSELQQPKD